MRTRPAAGAWALVGSVLAAWCLAAVAAWSGWAPAAGGSGTVPPGSGADLPAQERQVVLVGVPGLTWDQVSPARTPELARLAREGGAAALVLRGTHEVTCEADAWLTLGAGQRAATDLTGCGDAGPEDAGGTRATLGTAVDDGGVDERRWEAWQHAAAARALGPELGSLAGLAEDGGTCVAAYGRAAVVGAAGAQGSAAWAVAAREDTLAPLAAAADAVGGDGEGGSRCRIHLVSAPPLAPGGASQALVDLDDAVGQLAAALPDGTTLLVSGMGQVGGQAQAQVLLAAPVHAGSQVGASLTSGSTRQRGLVQLTDLTPTLLQLAGVAPAGAALAGAPVAAAPEGDPLTLARELAGGVSTAKSLAPVALGALLALVVPALGVGGALALRPRTRRAGRILVLAAASVATAVPVATWLAGLTPWWRTGQPLAAVVGVVVLWATLVAVTAWAGPWRRHPLGPPAWIAALTLVVVGVDVIWSARLGLVSVLGLQPVTAGRFFGQGNVGLGILLGALLILLAAVLTWLRDRRREAAAAAGLLGLAATVVNGAPQAGADFGGVPALVVATGLLMLSGLGIRWSWPSLVGVLAVGGLVGVAVMVLDWLRGPERRTHLGGFVQSALDGEAVTIVTRKLSQSLGILLGYPVSWVAVVTLVAVVAVAIGRPAWSERVWQHAGTRPAVLAGAVSMVLAWVLNDSGLPAMGVCLALLIAAGLTVLARGPGREARSPAGIGGPQRGGPAPSPCP